MSRAVPSPASLDNAKESGLSRALLPEHHVMIERACRAILAATYADLAQALVTAWRPFEHELLEHMVAEEDELLPPFADACPDEAAQIRSEHATLRHMLAMVAIDVELHGLRADKLLALLAELRAHAEREDARLYPWASRHLDGPSSQRATLRIRASIARLARLGSPGR